MMMGMIGDGRVVVGGGVTFAPANHSTFTTLSNGNLTATGGNAAEGTKTFTTTSASTGKYYAEFTVTNGGGSGIGIEASSIAVPDNGSYLGEALESVAYWDDGSVYKQGSIALTLDTYTTGDVICMALNLTDNLVWFRKNSGNWNVNPFADPVTNAGGYGIEPASAYVPGVELFDVASAITCQFIPTYAFTPPVGYGNWP